MDEVVRTVSGAPGTDAGRPHPARVYDCLLGGKDHYPVDAAFAARMPAAARDSCLASRDFMRRAVRWVARRGVRQFLDLGTGIPTEPNLHQVAQEVWPEAAVLYVDNDPVVLAHARARLSGTAERSVGYLEADALDPGPVLAAARSALDFGRPVALSLIALLHFVPDSAEPHALVRRYVDALPPGSHLLLSHGTRELLPAPTGVAIHSVYDDSGIPLVSRTREEAALLRRDGGAGTGGGGGGFLGRGGRGRRDGRGRPDERGRRDIGARLRSGRGVRGGRGQVRSVRGCCRFSRHASWRVALTSCFPGDLTGGRGLSFQDERHFLTTALALVTDGRRCADAPSSRPLRIPRR
ncbi:SAM-dependent methyltransferase [Streptomyces sp. SID11385]|uniref:SAM-dependent methyltransferase n=1 Tax=Streptomyces sp. SID11385 TaxID=2706031 RepID=UPI0013C96560|nr:hypothetical protein [Streptomyces sp. SID11385]